MLAHQITFLAKYSVLYLFLHLFLIQNSIAQDSEKSHWNNIETFIRNSFGNDTTLQNCHYSFTILRQKNKQAVLSINQNMAMIPASNLKLLTTMAGLDLLKPDFRFETNIYYSGYLSNDSCFRGNLYIVGTGDPTLGSSRFTKTIFQNQILKALKEKGIKLIKGKIIACMTEEDLVAIPNQWTWGDIGNYYGAACYSLNFNENLYQVQFKPNTKTQQPDILSINPPFTNEHLINKVNNGKIGSGDKSNLYTSPWHQKIIAKGTVVPKQGKETVIVKGAMPNPAKALTRTLLEFIVQQGIAVEGTDTVLFLQKLSIDSIQNFSRLIKLESEALSEIVYHTNQFSINLFAEAIYKKIASKLNTKSDYDSLNIAIKNYWRKNGLSIYGMNVSDGSGLSCTNTISTRQVCDALVWASKSTWYEVFKKSLPTAGITGTMQNFSEHSSIKGNLKAKTGTLSRVSCYSGLFDFNNEQFVFSIMINFYDGKPTDLQKKIERIMVKILTQ